jgi:3-oxoacyl-[acyl-carrier protein] reductase
MSSDFSGRKVVITGAAGLYGSELACAFAAAGASLCLSDLRADALAAVAQSLALPAARLITHATDLAREDSIQDLIATVTRAWRAPDVVINNAGVYPFGGLLEIDVAFWDRVLGVNLRAPFLIMQGFAKAMLEHGVTGNFVNISSGAAELLRTNGVPYCVSKRGLEWLAKGFALDLAKRGIRVNLVRPGLGAGALAEFPPDYIETMQAAVPMGRTSAPGELADAVMFLASDAARSITGACLAVDAGGSIPRRHGAATEARR